MTNFKYVNFWLLQGHLSSLGKFIGLQKINFFLIKEWQIFDEAWGGVLGGQVLRLYGGTIFGGVRHTWGVRWGIEHESSVFLTHLWQLRGYSALTDLVKNQSTGVD